MVQVRSCLLDHLGHQEQAALDGAGALRWLASRWLGSLTDVVAQAQGHVADVATGCASGSMPVVSTARIFSTMSKNSLICVSMRSRSSGASSKAGQVGDAGNISRGQVTWSFNRNRV